LQIWKRERRRKTPKPAPTNLVFIVTLNPFFKLHF
jgi:hypothetical protein